MSLRVLIVEDDPFTAESFTDLLVGLQHEADVAATMEEARSLLAQQTYAYAILDMAIPVSPGKMPQRETGRLLLGEIRRDPRHAELPVVVVTGADDGNSDFVLSVAKTGGYEPPRLSYVQKVTIQLDKGDINHETMTRKIGELLSGRQSAFPDTPPQRPTKLFPSAQRTVTVYRRQIDVCGIKIWGKSESPDMRTAMVKLNRKDPTGRYRAFRGTELVPERNASNPVGAMIERFRKSATVRLLADRDLECGSQDIIATERRKGYFLREWVTVEVVDAEGPADDPAQSTSVLCHGEGFGAAPAPAFNEAPATAPAAHESQPFSPTERQREIPGRSGVGAHDAERITGEDQGREVHAQS